MPVVSASIAPIRARDLRLDHLAVVLPEAARIAAAETDGLHVVRFDAAGRVDQATLDHAGLVADRILGMLDRLPQTELGGDLIAMAYAVKHYRAAAQKAE